MLALDDQGLARIFIAGTAVAPGERSTWLEQLAARLEPARELTPGVRHTRRWRQRQRDGRILLRLEVDEAALVVGLVDRGLLAPLKADDAAAISRAAAKALALFCNNGDASRPDAGIRAKLTADLIAAAQRRENGEGRRLRKSDEGRTRALRRRGR